MGLELCAVYCVLCIVLTGHRGGRLVWYCVLYFIPTEQRGVWFGIVYCVLYQLSRGLVGWVGILIEI